LKSRMWKLLIPAVLIVVLLPVMNLFVKADNSNKLSRSMEKDASFQPVAAVLEGKCAGCHVPGANLPFYADFPLAGGLIHKDIARGLRFIDMQDAFSSTEGPVSQPVLAKLEYVLSKDSMPPLRYRVMHWDSGLDDKDRDVMSTWIHDVRAAHYINSDSAPRFRDEAVQPLPLAGRLEPRADGPGRAALT